MNPKHLPEGMPEQPVAVAPYNFVELPDKIVPAESILPQDRYHQDFYTGKIECKLTTSSPLYIRCGITPDDFIKFGGKPDEDLNNDQSDKEFDIEKKEALALFFKTPGNFHPMIPGSSLRGMLRTLVEIVSYSKIEQVSDRQLIYRAFADTTTLGDFYRERLLKTEDEERKRYSFLMQAGYIVKNEKNESGWAIKPAQELSEGTSFARIGINQIQKLVKRRWNNIQHACEVSIKIEPMQWHPCKEGFVELYYARAFSPLPQEARRRGVLIETGGLPGQKKLECVLGLPNEDIPPIDIPRSIIQDYRNQLSKEQIKLLGKEGALKQNHPIFYLIENDELVFFGHTMMFRLPYEQSIQNFISPNLVGTEHQSNNKDIAESIFGFVKHEKNKQDQSLAGRVSMSDAVCTQTVNEDIWLKDDETGRSIMPKILATPKPTTFQHYLVQPDPNQLKHYANVPVTETVIRGHKLYWHQGDVERNQIEEHNQNHITESPKQYTKIQPIKANVCFDFEINFNNLTKVELGALFWVLNIAQDEQYRLSLGMGKPLGMGAIKIKPKLYLSKRNSNDNSSRYAKLFEDKQWQTGEFIPSNEDIEDLVNKFESYICKAIGETVPLKEVKRIKMLLAMLNWQKHPPVESTRYMEIERDISLPHIGRPKSRKARKINEYSKRPILPTPLQVIEGDYSDRSPSAPSINGGGSGGSINAALQRPKKSK